MRTRATVAREHVLQDLHEQDGEMTETVRPSLHPGQYRSFSPSIARCYGPWRQI